MESSLAGRSLGQQAAQRSDDGGPIRDDRGRKRRAIGSRGKQAVEPAHRLLLDYLGLEPLLDINMRLGEGTGAALGIFVAETAVKILGQMATFSEAGVSPAAPLELES